MLECIPLMAIQDRRKLLRPLHSSVPDGHLKGRYSDQITRATCLHWGEYGYPPGY